MFKRFLIILLIALLLPTTALAGSGQFTLTQVYYPILSNGQNIDTEDKPVLNLDGSTYLPVRKLSEALGIPILWDDTAKQIKITTCDPVKLAESCVEIYVSAAGKDLEQGSGVLIGYDQILTCHHVTTRGTAYRALYNGSGQTDCSMTKYNTDYDFSILKPKNVTVKPVKIGDSDDVKVGDKVYVISSPKQNKNVTSIGEIMGYDSYLGVSGISVKVNVDSGSSGGAVFDLHGNLIGISKAILPSGNCLIIPINDIRKAMAN